MRHPTVLQEDKHKKETPQLQHQVNEGCINRTASTPGPAGGSHFLAFMAVTTMPPRRAAKVKPWARIRARISSCERRVWPRLKLMRP